MMFQYSVRVLQRKYIIPEEGRVQRGKHHKISKNSTPWNLTTNIRTLWNHGAAFCEILKRRNMGPWWGWDLESKEATDRNHKSTKPSSIQRYKPQTEYWAVTMKSTCRHFVRFWRGKTWDLMRSKILRARKPQYPQNHKTLIKNIGRIWWDLFADFCEVLKRKIMGPDGSRVQRARKSRDSQNHKTSKQSTPQNLTKNTGTSSNQFTYVFLGF